MFFVGADHWYQHRDYSFHLLIQLLSVHSGASGHLSMDREHKHRHRDTHIKSHHRQTYAHTHHIYTQDTHFLNTPHIQTHHTYHICMYIYYTRHTHIHIPQARTYTLHAHIHFHIYIHAHTTYTRIHILAWSSWRHCFSCPPSKGSLGIAHIENTSQGS